MCNCFIFLRLAIVYWILFFFSSRRRHTRYWRDWSSDVCSSDLYGVARRQFAVMYVCLAVTDGLCFAVALLTAALAQFDRVGVALGTTMIVSPIVLTMIFAWLGLYHSHVLPPAEEFRRLIVGVSLAIIAVVTVSFWADVTFSRLWVALSWALALLLTLSSRRFWHWGVARERE